MTTVHHENIIRSRRLFLTKGRVFRHYLDATIIAVISFALLYFIAKGFLSRTGYYDSPYLLIFLMFPVLSLILFVKQYSALRLKEINTKLPKEVNYRLVKETLRTLGWTMKVDNRGFIEAYTNSFGLLTWTDQMVSILITEGKILFNSISNVDSYATQAITYGQNKRNMKKFAETLELLSVSRTAQQPTERL